MMKSFSIPWQIAFWFSFVVRYIVPYHGRCLGGIHNTLYCHVSQMGRSFLLVLWRSLLTRRAVRFLYATFWGVCMCPVCWSACEDDFSVYPDYMGKIVVLLRLSNVILRTIRFFAFSFSKRIIMLFSLALDAYLPFDEEFMNCVK